MGFTFTARSSDHENEFHVHSAVPATTKMHFTFTAPLQRPRKRISRSQRRSSDHENGFHVHGAAPAPTKMHFTFTAPFQLQQTPSSSAERYKIFNRSKERGRGTE